MQHFAFLACASCIYAIKETLLFDGTIYTLSQTPNEVIEIAERE